MGHQQKWGKSILELDQVKEKDYQWNQQKDIQ